MDTEQFLARVVAPGNFIAIGYNRKPGTTGHFNHQFFPEGEGAQAARYARWCASKGMDAYHAMASYTVATPDGQDPYGHTKYRGERTQANAQRLKAFWVDLDVKRAGDKKLAGGVYATQADAFAWLKSFMVATGLPKPNLAVNSGYGIHVYWVLEDALATADWQPYADALKAALLKHNLTGDAGISSDAARVLRPPGTNNMKSGQPMPVTDIGKLSAGDYPNALILNALQPYVGLIAAKPQAQQVGTASALAGGGGAVVQGVFAGKATPNMAAAAQANAQPAARPREFARIATQCEQVRLSLANHGKGENRPLWMLGNLTLAHFCTDGADFVHPLGDHDPRYSPAGTDAAVAKIAAEHAKDGFGPPKCAYYDGVRQNVCTKCAHHTKINSPWDLGVDDGDLPDNYRRGKRGIEVRIKTKDDVFWVLVLAGDVHTATLDELSMGGYALQFVYQRRVGKAWTIRVDGDELGGDPGVLYRFFQKQNLVLMNATLAGHWRDFILGWIDKLREQRAERTEIIHPFGWSYDVNNKPVGYAVGGTLYTPDGREVATPGGDPMLVKIYKPSGTLPLWQQAAAFVMAGRMDLQVLVAASFGAPLMVFTGHAGLVISAWSRQSAVGKSSGIRVGQSIWSAAISMNSIDDTNNFVLKKVADVRSMPCYWDEMKVGSDNSDKMVSLALSLSQGKGKGRMNADTSLKEVGEWDTILVAASNYPLMDHIVAKTDGTDAGAVRLFEYAISRPPTPDTSAAARLIAQTKTNYGLAGRVFAKWIAGNYDKTDKIVCLLKDTLNVELNAEQAERFYIAGMAATLGGARIANHLGICSFDLAGLKAFMCTEFLRMRSQRKVNVVVSQSGYDLEQVLASFMSDSLRHKLVTRWFAVAGPKKVPQDFVKWRPQDANKVDVHVSQDDRVMRVNRNAFTEWCRKKSYPASDMIEQLGHVYGATTGRKSIGSGTGWGGGQIYCIDIPLTLPELDAYRYADPANQAPAPGAAPASPSAGLKGNKPKGATP
jgi:hypothetical protein